MVDDYCSALVSELFVQCYACLKEDEAAAATCHTNSTRQLFGESFLFTAGF